MRRPNVWWKGRGSEATVHNFCQIGVNQPLTTPATLILSNTCKRRPVTQLMRDGAGTLVEAEGPRRGFPDPQSQTPHHAAPSSPARVTRARAVFVGDVV